MDCAALVDVAQSGKSPISIEATALFPVARLLLAASTAIAPKFHVATQHGLLPPLPIPLPPSPSPSPWVFWSWSGSEIDIYNNFAILKFRISNNIYLIIIV